MEQLTQSPKLIRQRKFLMVLPLLALPFLTFLFWSLGGGKIKEANAVNVPTGLNINLPDVNLKDDRPQSKMDYYNQAQSDSAKFRELIKNDPHYNVMAFNAYEDEFEVNGEHSLLSERKGINSSLYGVSENNDQNEERVYKKLEQLNRELGRIDAPNEDHSENPPLYSNPSNTSVSSADIDRLEQMMQVMSQPDGEDEEITQLNTMLEKILDIQHPDRVQEKLKQTSVERKGQVFAMAVADHSVSVSSLVGSHPESKSSNGFYSLEDPMFQTEIQNAVQAVIHDTQILVNGSTVKLRLIDDVYINGVLIPKNQFLFGTASLNGERLTIKISSIRYQNSLFPVELSVYDIDGLNGIYIPGAIGRDVAKESADRSMQTIGLATLDPSLSAQATSAGIEAAKTLFSRKVKLVKVTVKAGYQVLLKDEKQK